MERKFFIKIKIKKEEGFSLIRMKFWKWIWLRKFWEKAMVFS